MRDLRSVSFPERFTSKVKWLFCLMPVMVILGCGSGMNGNVENTPATVSLSANPTSIAAGGSSTLTATAANATQVVVTGSDGSRYTLASNGGTQNVTPSSTTMYTATATGFGGNATATATVTVTANPVTVTLSGSPSSVSAGESSVLTAVATNATQVVITGSDGSSYTLPGTGGTQSVTPSATTTYTATATGSAGRATANTVVTVVSIPVTSVTLSANPTSITAGGSSQLTVTAANATGVVITGSDGSRYTLPATGGTQSVTPSSTTTYTATALGLAGNAMATATVTVTANPAATVTLTATPTSVAPGSSSVLTATATNATGVIITGSDGSSYTLTPTGGTQSVTPSATTTYTATATGAGGNASASTTVTVSAKPVSVTLNASPTSISSGGSSNLTATATNATDVVITGSDGSRYTLSPTGGTQSVSPSATTTYTATATGAGGSATATATVSVAANPATVTLSANPASIAAGGSSVLTATATNATQVVITGSDGSSYTLSPTGGNQTVTPASTTVYTATASGAGANATATATVTVAGDLKSINHVIFLLQENRSFDSYFGMLNKYRSDKGFAQGDDGKTYAVDGIDDKLTKISNENDELTSFSPFKLATSCVDDMSSSWLESYGDVSRYDFTLNRPIVMDGFVHTAENFAKNCNASGNKGCAAAGPFTDTAGRRAMGYYDDGLLNYYYYMASQFALSDRWFSPVSSKSVPNRIATFTGGTTQGLVFDPGNDDQLPQLGIHTIFEELTQNNVSWKIYFTVTQGTCLDYDDCQGNATDAYPATNFSFFQESYKYLHSNPTGAACAAPTQPSSVIGDKTNSFCVDPTHIQPLSQYYKDVANGTLPSFAFIEAGYGINDEHPGSGQSILSGQQQVAKLANALMNSGSWKDSVFFVAYDEGGGPYDHVPPVQGHSNDFTDSMVGSMPVANIPDISSISVNPDTFFPCTYSGTPTTNCDLRPMNPGADNADAAHIQGFAAQLGFRVPNMVISPFVKKHYVSHVPMDHTAILKFVENRFIGSSTHLTARDAAQPDLTDFFDFTHAPWLTPPTPPTPVTPATLGYDPCKPATLGP